MPQTFSKRLPEAAFAGATLLAGAALYVLTPQYVSGWAFNIPGTTDVALTPAFFPRLAASVVVVASTLVLLTIPLREEVLPIQESTPTELKRVALGFIAIFAYILGVTLLGFVSASILFIVLVSWMGGYRKPIVLISTAIFVIATIRLVFRFGLNVNLPTGVLI